MVLLLKEPAFIYIMRTNGKIQLYPMLRIAICLASGILLGDLLYGLVTWYMWTAVIASLLLAYFLSRNHCIVQSTLIFVACMLCGSLLVCLERTKTEIQIPDCDIVYKAVIVSQPKVTDKVVRCDIVIPDTSRSLKVRASFLRDGYAEALHVGDGVEVVSRLEPPANYEGSTFDYWEWLLHHGYSATTFIGRHGWRGAEVDLTPLSYLERSKIVALRFRGELLERYKKMFPDADGYAILAAMTLGDKSSLSSRQKDEFSVSGASHVLALSGLHLGIIYVVLTFLFSGFRNNVLSRLPVLFAIWIYVFIVGLPVSAVRSAVMFTIYTFVIMLNRERISLNALSFAAVVILVNNPFDLYDVGFQMSFMSVLSIIIYFNPIYRLMPDSVLGVLPLKRFWQLIVVSLTAQIGVAPLILHYFGRFSCYFLLTNIIVVPLVTAILYIVLLVLFTGFVPYVQSLLVALLGSIVALLNTSVSFVASLPGASFDNIRFNLLQVVLVYIIIACVSVIAFYMRKTY